MARWERDTILKRILYPLILDVVAGRQRHLNVYGTDYKTPDGTCIRDYIHVTDLASAHAMALEYLLNTDKSDVFNLGNDRGYSVKETIKIGEQITKRPIEIRAAPRREGDPPILISSSDKIKKILGWKLQYTDLASIIESAWNWYRKDHGR